MSKLRTIPELEQALLPLAAITKQMTGRNVTANRTQDLLRFLGNPEQSIRVVHVAGTSGKSSTTAYIAALLTAAGKKVGHTTSPHLDSITERVQLQGKPLSDAVFCDYNSRFLDVIQDYRPTPSWQEYFTAFALWVFQQESVDYAVLETAVGGLHDATNAVANPSKVCVITDIGFDHMELLGTTLESITANKAGIIHPGNTVFLYNQGPVVTKIITDYAARQQAEMTIVSQPHIAGSMPHFQQRNWGLAHAVYIHLTTRDALPQLTQPALEATQQIVIPGRMEAVQAGDTTIVMDGAHNPQKMAAMAESFAGQYPTARVPIMLALKDTKDMAATIAPLAGVASTVLATTFPPVTGVAIAAADPQKLATAVQDQGIDNVHVIPDVHKCLADLLELHEPVVIVTGSFYLLAAVRHLLAANATTA